MAKKTGIVRVTVVGATEVSIDDLQDIQGDLKELTVEAYETGKASIIAEGFCEPLTIWRGPDNAGAYVISGKQRWRVVQTMREEGWQVPLLPANIVEAVDEHEALKKALALASSWGTTTSEGLYEILHRIGGDAQESLKQFRAPNINNDEFMRGFFKDGVPNAADMLEDNRRKEPSVINAGTGVDPDAAPEAPKKARTRRGDLYILGDHRLLCGDSTVQADVERLMEGKKADMAFTDPPYGVDYSGGIQAGKDGIKKNGREKLANDADDSIYTKVIPMLATYVDGPVYTWFAGSKGAKIYEAIAQVGQVHALLVWNKINAGFGALNAHYKQKHEVFLYWKPKKSTLRWAGTSNEITIWDQKRESRNTYHPTQKPVELAERAISNHLVETVLDLFGGSGSTLIGAERMGKRALIMELDCGYCDVIVDRWETFTGKKAQLVKLPSVKTRKKQ